MKEWLSHRITKKTSASLEVASFVALMVLPIFLYFAAERELYIVVSFLLAVMAFVMFGLILLIRT